MEEKKIKVMVVEDEELLLTAISRKLATLGFETITCSSAQQALDYLDNLPQMPDAIWLDYYLGDMNGLEFMHKLKENEKWSTIPVVVVSNSAGADKRSAMLSLGANDYILKAQYKLGDIANHVKEIVEKKQEGDKKQG